MSSFVELQVHFHFKVLKKTSGSSLMSENSRLPVDDEDGEYGSGGSSTEVPMPVTKLEQSQFLQFHCEYISPEGPSHTQREVSVSIQKEFYFK